MYKIITLQDFWNFSTITDGGDITLPKVNDKINIFVDYFCSVSKCITLNYVYISLTFCMSFCDGCTVQYCTIYHIFVLLKMMVHTYFKIIFFIFQSKEVKNNFQIQIFAATFYSTFYYPIQFTVPVFTTLETTSHPVADFYILKETVGSSFFIFFIFF